MPIGVDKQDWLHQEVEHVDLARIFRVVDQLALGLTTSAYLRILEYVFQCI